MMNSMLWMGEKPLCTLTFPVRLSRVRCTCAVCSCLYLQQQTGTRLPCSGRGCGGPVRTDRRVMVAFRNTGSASHIQGGLRRGPPQCAGTCGGVCVDMKENHLENLFQCRLPVSPPGDSHSAAGMRRQHVSQSPRPGPAGTNPGNGPLICPVFWYTFQNGLGLSESLLWAEDGVSVKAFRRVRQEKGQKRKSQSRLVELLSVGGGSPVL